ncbi:hypothetical protein Slin14017_G042860 [Septoria linicola]|nr:hypothetical protein Slin14017_G042860 [Septoria linicola]
MATSLGASPPTDCLILDRLAAELRNSIYKLAFTPDRDIEEVDFFAAAPPSSALLLTCRQIKNEARGIHRAAYRSYWRSAKFFILEREVDLKQGLPVPIRDINRIQDLRVIGPCTTGSYSFDLLDKRGVWKFVASDENGEVMIEEPYTCEQRKGSSWSDETAVRWEEHLTVTGAIVSVGLEPFHLPFHRQIKHAVQKARVCRISRNTLHNGISGASWGQLVLGRPS